jgi:hypothetical protein
MTTEVNAQCKYCKQLRVPYHGALLCLNCDNRIGNEQADWAIQWAKEYENGQSE